MDTFDDIREAVARANPEGEGVPWETGPMLDDGLIAEVFAPDGDIVCKCFGNAFHLTTSKDIARYIAMANPKRIGELLAALDRANCVCVESEMLAQVADLWLAYNKDKRNGNESPLLNMTLTGEFEIGDLLSNTRYRMLGHARRWRREGK